MTTGAEVVAEARRHLGVRWRHQGRNLALSVDCIGYVGGVGLALGVPGERQWRSQAFPSHPSRCLFEFALAVLAI